MHLRTLIRAVVDGPKAWECLGTLASPEKTLPPSNPADYVPGHLLQSPPTMADVLFIFLLGVAVLTAVGLSGPSWKHLPAAGISSSALLLVALFR